MIGTNHLATGAVIALAVHNPLLALPLAFASHFVLDSVPHFGFKTDGFATVFKHKISYFALSLEVVMFVLLAYLIRNAGVWVFVGALVAGSPDSVWLARYFVWERQGKNPPSYTNGPLTRFHGKIQWCERPWGLVVDIIWLCTMTFAITKLI